MKQQKYEVLETSTSNRSKGQQNAFNYTSNKEGNTIEHTMKGKGN